MEIRRRRSSCLTLVETPKGETEFHLARKTGTAFVGSRRLQRSSVVMLVVDEVAARSVRTQSCGVVRPTQVGLVLGMARDGAQVVAAVCELTLVAVAARAVLGERAAQLRLVPRRHGRRAAAAADERRRTQNVVHGVNVRRSRCGRGRRRRRGSRQRQALTSLAPVAERPTTGSKNIAAVLKSNE